MQAGRETSIARLLEETLGAHGEYETTVLGGIYDDDWSDWYATYLLKHGLPDLLPDAEKLSAAQLGAILKQLDADYRRGQPEGEWPACYAEHIGAMVEQFKS